MAVAKTVDGYIADRPEWADALAKLRGVLLKSGLEETVKWGTPCYVLGGKNVVGLVAFQSYVGLWFHQGVFLSDLASVLVNASGGKTKALRQWRFGSAKEIKVRLVGAYVNEAIEHQRAGHEVKPDRTKPLVVPDELRHAFERDDELRAAFEALSPGKRREFAEHIAGAKRESTRLGRSEKAAPLIRAGRGLHDRYRSC
jgi:uncharacterized protein YdeI (YjbR/CyaY-like superfamily)